MQSMLSSAISGLRSRIDRDAPGRIEPSLSEGPRTTESSLTVDLGADDTTRSLSEVVGMRAAPAATAERNAGTDVDIAAIEDELMGLGGGDAFATPTEDAAQVIPFGPSKREAGTTGDQPASNAETRGHDAGHKAEQAAEATTIGTTEMDATGNADDDRRVDDLLQRRRNFDPDRLRDLLTSSIADMVDDLALSVEAVRDMRAQRVEAETQVMAGRAEIERLGRVAGEAEGKARRLTSELEEATRQLAAERNARETAEREVTRLRADLGRANDAIGAIRRHLGEHAGSDDT